MFGDSVSSGSLILVLICHVERCAPWVTFISAVKNGQLSLVLLCKAGHLSTACCVHRLAGDDLQIYRIEANKQLRTADRG